MALVEIVHDLNRLGDHPHQHENGIPMEYSRGMIQWIHRSGLALKQHVHPND